jgi:LysR family transcriptional regulator, glycine cleavage system transcriptional activator
MRRLPPLHALRAFEAAARHLSFKKAGVELGISPTAISHHVRLLEETLGRRLFDRTARQVRLTSAGQTLYPILRESLDGMAAGIELVRASRRDRSITLTATLAFTARWLVPRMGQLRAQLPEAGIRLLASDDVVDLTAGSADLAIRYGAGGYKNCRTDLMLPGRFAPVCSPKLAVLAPEDLAGQTLIHFEWRRLRSDTPLWSRWFAQAGLRYPKARELVFSDETHALQAAASGEGVVLASLVLIVPDLRSGVLHCPFGPILNGDPYLLVTPEEKLHDPLVAAVRSWLLEQARTEGADLLGLTARA